MKVPLLLQLLFGWGRVVCESEAAVSQARTFLQDRTLQSSA